MNDVLTINAAADALQVSRRTIYYWIRSGYLKVEPSPSGKRVFVRVDSAAFGVKPAWRSRKVDRRTADRLAAKARRTEAA